jgi:glycosyltransferase involved in cell wall biosynthesis
VLYFGRLTHEKGIFDALSALGRLSASAAGDWRLRVAGWGDAQAVRARARELGLEQRIDFLGPLSRGELAGELASAQLALLPSWSESFGLANAEAQAAGVAVVAYAAGAVPEVVLDGETGWLAPPRDVPALAAALASALADPAERARRGAAGRARVLERFTWESAARATLAGLEEAVLARR